MWKALVMKRRMWLSVLMMLLLQVCFLIYLVIFGVKYCLHPYVCVCVCILIICNFLVIDAFRHVRVLESFSAKLVKIWERYGPYAFIYLDYRTNLSWLLRASSPLVQTLIISNSPIDTCNGWKPSLSANIIARKIILKFFHL